MLLREMAKSNNANSAQIVESSPTEESDGRMFLREMAKSNANSAQVESSPIEESDDDSKDDGCPLADADEDDDDDNSNS